MKQQSSSRHISFQRRASAVGRFGLSAAVALVFGQSARAATATWNNAGTVDFNTGTNWTGGTGAGGIPGTGDNATFAAATPTLQPDLSGPLTIQGLTSSTAAGGWILGSANGSLLTLTNTGTTTSSAINGANTSGTDTVSANLVLGGAAGTTATFTQARAGIMILSGNISSTNAITGLSLATSAGTGAGTSTFTLSGNNTYAGNTTITTNETVNINSATAISAGTLIFSGNATVDNTSATTALVLANNNNINLSGGSLTYTGTGGSSLSFGGGVLTVSSANRTATINGGTVTIGSINTDLTTRTFTKAGAGTLVITGAAGANFQGGFLLTGGTLVIANGADLGTGLFTANGTLQGSANLSGLNKITNTVLINGTLTASGTNSIEFGTKVTGNTGGSRTVTNNLNGVPLTLNDIDINNGAGTVRSFTFNGTGNTIVNGVITNGAGTTTANTVAFQGVAGSSTTVNNGGSTYSGGSFLSTSTATLALGADSNPSAVGSTVTSGPIGSGGLTFTNGTIMAFGGARTIANAFTIFSGGIIGGTNDLTFNGPVQWTGTGAASFTVSNTGTTTFGGVFTMRNNAAPSPSGNRAVTVQGPGNVVMSGAIVNGFSINGSLNVNTTGATTLSGNNTYSGITTIGNGTTATLVKLGHVNALGFGGVSNVAGGAFVSTGSTLDLNGQTGLVKQITVNGTGVGGNGALINSNTSKAATIGNGVAGLAIAGGLAGGGSGYSAPPIVTISGTGSGAAAIASLGLTNASVTVDPGTQTYSAAPTVTITGGGGQGAVGTAVLDGTGLVTSVTFLDGSTGQANDSRGTGFTSVPTIVFSGGTVLAAGTAPTATGNANNFQVAALQMTSAGTGYTATPTVSFDSGSAFATAVISGVILNSATDNAVGGAGDIVINALVTGGPGNPLTKVGNGKLSLAGANTYQGVTNVNAGTLLITGSLTGTSSVLVAAQAVLGGSGTISTFNGMTVSDQGMVAPGAGLGTLNLDGSLDFGPVLSAASGAVFRMELNSGFQSDTVQLLNGAVGDIVFGGSTVNFFDLSGGALAVGSYTLFTADTADAYSGLTFDGNNHVNGGLHIGTGLAAYPGSTLDVSGNAIVLNVVPEPGAALSLLGGLGLLVGMRRRRA